MRSACLIELKQALVYTLYLNTFKLANFIFITATTTTGATIARTAT